MLTARQRFWKPTFRVFIICPDSRGTPERCWLNLPPPHCSLTEDLRFKQRKKSAPSELESTAARFWKRLESTCERKASRALPFHPLDSLWRPGNCSKRLPEKT